MERASIISRVKLKMDELTPPGVSLPFEDYIGPVIDEAAKEIVLISPLKYLAPLSLISRSLTRACADNVATIKTDRAHNLLIGNKVMVSGMTDNAYNGTFTITVVSDTIHFGFALAHANETETADTGGTATHQRIFENNLCYIPVPANFLRLYEFKFPLWVMPVRGITNIDSDEGRRQDNPYLKSGIGRPTVYIREVIPTGGYFGKWFHCGKVETAVIPSTLLYVKLHLPQELSDSLIDILAWLSASKLFVIMGYPDKAKITYEQYGISFKSIINN
jgi:hypothetical protein